MVIVIAPVHIIFALCRVECKRGTIRRVKYWEIIADNVSKGGMELGAVCRLWIAKDKQSGLQTHIAGTESVSLCVRMKG
jgi:hypothetical protein